MKRLPFLFVLLVAAAPLHAADDKPFFFQKGDRVVFVGDSITEQYLYSTDIELYLTTRFPANKRDSAWRAAELYSKRVKNEDKAKANYALVPQGSSRYRDAQKKLKEQ